MSTLAFHHPASNIFMEDIANETAMLQVPGKSELLPDQRDCWQLTLKQTRPPKHNLASHPACNPRMKMPMSSKVKLGAEVSSTPVH
jgi:hypothetical protein